MSSTGPSGRSPFPSRTRGGRIRTSFGAADSSMATNDSAASLGLSPYLMSTSATTTPTPSGGGGLLTQGMNRHSPAAAAGWSPVPNTRSNSHRRRFFGDGSTTAEGRGGSSNRGVLSSSQQQQIGNDGGVLGTAIPPPTSTTRGGRASNNSNHETNNGRSSGNNSNTAAAASATIMADGMNLTQLRSLTQEALGVNPTVTASPGMAVFYASILYSKTKLEEDAFLYAQALAQNGEYRRSVRLVQDTIQQQQQGNSPSSSCSYWEATLLAAQSLAALGEWEEALTILEQATMMPYLEDDDDAGWDALAARVTASVDDSSSNTIHPISRLCLWRGKAYDETSHPTRAALYWKRALWIDAKCVEALDAMLGRSVATPQEAHDLLSKLHFEVGMEWLRCVYLARLDLPQDASSTNFQKENKEPSSSVLFGDAANHANGGQAMDASSIVQQTPHTMQYPSSVMMTDNYFVDVPQEDHHDENDNEKDRKLPAVATSGAPTTQIGKDVDAAFDRLWTVHKLHQSPEVLALAAIRSYRRYNLPAALSYCQALVKLDPLCPSANFVYVATLVALGHKRLLFGLAHEWVEANPKLSKAWFAVGSYYYACGRYHVAQRHYCRATRLDPQCTEAWIAFGCAFAACDESDQALASFRAAQRLAPAQHASLLYMGMEYLRTNHLVLAQHFLTAALQTSGGDPLCLHELGVAAWSRQDYDAAVGYFARALRTTVETSRQLQGGTTAAEALPPTSFPNKATTKLTTDECIDLIQDTFWEPTLFNLGQCYRKLRKFEEASHCFEKCAALCPGNASSYAALGFTKHLMSDLDGAIELYHQALSQKPDDPFSSEMLNRALQEALSLVKISGEGDPLPNNANSSLMSGAGSHVLSPQSDMASFFSPDMPRPGGGSALRSTSRRPGSAVRRDQSTSMATNLSLDSCGDVDMSLT